MALIYFIEDDHSISYVISKTLENQKHMYKRFESGETFFEAVRLIKPDLILLDIMLPNESGLDHLKTLKNNKETEDIPVIIISALSSELDKVEGLDLGADDYITKPFGVLELMSRIQSKLRKFKAKTIIEVGNVSINITTHEAICNGLISLTFKEFELLKLFAMNQDAVISRDEIFKAVWQSDLVLETRTIDMHIKTLRQKLNQHQANINIVTVRSVGYRLVLT